MAVTSRIPEIVLRYDEEEEVGVLTQKVAKYIEQAKFSDLPKEVIECAKLCIRDHIGNAVGSASIEPGRVIINSTKKMGGTPECTIIGDGAKTSLLNAAYVNTRLTTLNVYDDTFRSLGHAGATIIGATVAAAEAACASGRDLITAVVLGYDIATRIGNAYAAWDWQSGQLASQSWQIFGAVAGVANLLGLDERQIIIALGLAASSQLFQGHKITPWKPRKPMHPWTRHQEGRSLHAMLGTLAVIQAKDGFGGPLDTFDTDVFWAAAGALGCDYRYLTRGLGRDYAIMENSLRPTPSCRLVHAPLTGVKEILAEWPLKPEEIDQINVRTCSMAQSVMGRLPRKHAEVMWNLPYAVAMMVKGEKPGLNWATRENLEDPVTLSIAAKVNFQEGPVASEIVGKEGRWTATVEIVAKDGTRKTKYVPYAWGEPENPMTEDEHLDKFGAGHFGLLGETQAKELLAVLNNLEKCDGMSQVTDLVYPKS